MEKQKKEIKAWLIKLLPNLPISGIDALLEISFYELKDNKKIISLSGNHTKKAFLILKGSV